ncbi:protein TPX2 isoform X2 [Spinacia oleracea]|uniref:Protein TPX2 isoform X2 n=1 Tax=Spinacia oleracea TaxID=3562 RepID=A0A9R0I4X0_SPIOL|nr:protein TPX2 isoform X2 [Spinacia oleracea]
MEDSGAIMIDETYEFSAPRFYDFINGESEEDTRNAELWFHSALSHAPSPFMLRIKTSRSVQLSTLCDFGDAQTTMKASELLEPTLSSISSKELPSNLEKNSSGKELPSNLEKNSSGNENSNPNSNLNLINGKTKEMLSNKKSYEASCEKICKEDKSAVKPGAPCVKIEPGNNEGSATCPSQDVCTPKPPALSSKGGRTTTQLKKPQTAKRMASAIKDPTASKSKMQSHTKSAKPAGCLRRDTSNLSSSTGTPNFVQENQAIKRQKLEDGKTRQILNIKPPNLLHKTRPGVNTSSSNLCSTTAKTSKEDRKIYARDPPLPPVPFVSTAELMKKFQANTRESSLLQNVLSQGNTKLQLTRPKEPEFVYAQRVRFQKVKSSAELEEEMMAKMPKFKARPLNKKILEAPSLPPLPKSHPQKPEFQEFHLETMERANKNAEVSSVVSTESDQQKNQRKANHLTEPKTPVLQTYLRARPTKVKSSIEIEQEELEKIPKFKARPLSKKIFESKGELGLFSNNKKQVTIPQEFHFATDERIPPPSTSTMVDLFDKMSLHSESNHEKQLPRLTRPNPFQLYTEERGAEKERRLITELVQKQLEEEKARVPKATPYPYTTDFPVVPPKPDPKECTQPEPFQLESLIRHENEMKKEMEERRKKEREEARMRTFKAQPVLKEDPIPLPEKERKPLTDIQEFNHHVEHRAVDRAEFDKKIKEKETVYKRYRDEAEAEKQMEEEKALKHLRRTLVPHARPLPKFANPFVPQKSCKDPTKPKSPKLRVRQRKERKELTGTDVKAAQSAAAALMR